MPVKRRRNLAVTDGGSYYKEKRLEEFLDRNVHSTMVMKLIMMKRVIMKIMNCSNYRRVLPTVAIK